MAEVAIYSSDYCPYSMRAKALLRKKGVAFNEINVDRDEACRREMVARAGGLTSVPQIFIDGQHVGGCDNLHALDAKGELDPLLGRAA
ncbi:MAG: glutaredoxin 3 [Alphaproteobacteria bacterium]|nr:glutaredoxin 3 [Alphaproteobacteria bacterium]